MIKRPTLTLLLALAACSNAPNGPDAYRRGAAALAAGDPHTARVELMNAIKADPDSRAARILQARTDLALHDGAAALSEIDRARALGVPASDLAHLKAEALLLTGDPQGALAALADAAPANAPLAARLRAEALQAEGSDAAGAAYDDAIRAAPDDPLLWIDVARFRRGNGDLAGALDASARALAIDPKSSPALSLRGELVRGQYGLAAALPWFDQALAADPSNLTALLERAATLGDMGRTRAMLADTRAALSLSPGNPRAFFLQALLAARAGKFDLARSLYQRTKSAYDDQPDGMLLMGGIDFQAGNIEQAIKTLEPLVDRQPGNLKARRLLAACYWASGDADATAAALRPIADAADADSYSLSLIGRALAKSGHADAAAGYLARAARPQNRLAAAFAAPVDAETLQGLRDQAAARPGYAPAQTALIGALLGNGLGAEALDRALRLQAANPGAPDAHVLVGDARGMTGDFRGAAQDYRRAANLAFTEPVAMRMIEALDRSGQAGAATHVLQLFLQQNPRDVPARLLAAGRMMAVSDWPGAIRVYEGLRLEVGDSDAIMLNNLAWAYAQTGNFNRALPFAKRAWELDRNNPATTDTYGWLLVKSGRDKAQGLALLQRAARG